MSTLRGALSAFPKISMRKLIIAALVIAGLIGAAGIIGFWIAFGPNTQIFEDERGVGIPPGSNLSAVVDSLQSRGILQSEDTFVLVARATGWGDQIKAGHYMFESGVSNYDIIQKLRRGLQEPVRVTVPPGTRPEVVAAVAGRDMYFDPAAFRDALSDPALAESLSTDTTALFGYMLPETYFFYWLTSAPATVAKIKEQFDQFWQEELKAGADTLDLSKEEFVTLASIVEWETSLAEEKPKVAGVYLNRLRIGMKLDADPTVQYVVMQREGAKRRLLYQDYQIQHPYNTYLRGGLPPSPLNNPSPSSLRAVANPAEHQYLYFVAKGDGSHVFSRTLSEHNRAARRYHDLMRQRRAAQDSVEADS